MILFKLKVYKLVILLGNDLHDNLLIINSNLVSQNEQSKNKYLNKIITNFSEFKAASPQRSEINNHYEKNYKQKKSMQ